MDDNRKSISYVNAGHIEPFVIRKNEVCHLSEGGFLTGFVEEAEYETGMITLKKGDVLVAFTDGVPEVENPEGEELGVDSMIAFIKKKQDLTAREIIETFYKKISSFSKGKRFRDDFTLIVVKAK
jgi:sigma-B regulation protein RsbU (phosphoserine phosphatase)